MTVDTFHPELSFNLWTYADTPVTMALEIAEGHGFRRVGLPAPAVVAAFDQVADQLRRSGLVAAYLMHPPPFTLDEPDRWPDERSRFEESVAAAAALGAPVVYTTTANAGRLSWEDAATAAAEAFGPVRDHARACGVALAVETTSQMRQEYGFVSTLRDLVRLGEQCDLDLCADMYWCWREPDLARSAAAAVPRLRIVQLADYALGTTATPDRRVPGDGVAHLRWVVGLFYGAGFRGMWDLELVGPHIDAEGRAEALARGGRYVSTLLREVEGDAVPTWTYRKDGAT